MNELSTAAHIKFGFSRYLSSVCSSQGSDLLRFLFANTHLQNLSLVREVFSRQPGKARPTCGIILGLATYRSLPWLLEVALTEYWVECWVPDFLTGVSSFSFDILGWLLQGCEWLFHTNFLNFWTHWDRDLYPALVQWFIYYFFHL